MTTHLPSSYVFHIIFCEDSTPLNIKGITHPLIFSPYSTKKLKIPGSLDLNMSIGYQFRLKDEEEFVIKIITPSGIIDSEIPLGSLLTSTSKQSVYTDNEIVRGEMNLVSEEPLSVIEAGIFTFSVQLEGKEISKTYLEVLDANNKEHSDEAI